MRQGRTSNPVFAARRALSIGLSCVCLTLASWPLGAGDGPRRAHPPQADPKRSRIGSVAPLVLALPPSIEVEPVRARELIGSRSGTVVFEGDAPASGDIVTTVSRSLPRLWEIRVPVTRTAPTVQVSYEVIGADGRPNQLTSTSGQFSAVDVQLEAIPVRLRAGRTGEMILQGGVTMHLDLQQTRISGDYQGTLVVSVNRF